MKSARDERNEWKNNLEGGNAVEKNHHLDTYRVNRDDPTWRSNKEIEYLCEYILYLEGKVDRFKAKIDFERVHSLTDYTKVREGLGDSSGYVWSDENSS